MLKKVIAIKNVGRFKNSAAPGNRSSGNMCFYTEPTVSEKLQCAASRGWKLKLSIGWTASNAVLSLQTPNSAAFPNGSFETHGLRSKTHAC
jgi:hypothetical protein